MSDTLVRVPKEWDERCKECGGTGTIHRREHFALWTPGEYEKVMQGFDGHDGKPYIDPKAKGANDLPVGVMICIAHGGASIFEACREGVTLARAVQRAVAFEFNGAVAVCHAGGDPTAIAKEWWKRAYGKTYEQSYAER